MGKGLSPAARGQKRGALEILKEPPALFTKIDGTMAATVNSYSLLAVGVSTTWLALLGFNPLMAVLFMLATITFLISSIGGTMDYKRHRVRGVIKKTVRRTIENKNRAPSLSQALRNEFPATDPHIVENLTFRQEKWIAKTWKKEMKAATAVQKQFIHGNSAHHRLESLSSGKDVRRTAVELDELKKLKKETDPEFAQERFDKQFNDLSKRH